MPLGLGTSAWSLLWCAHQFHLHILGVHCPRPILGANIYQKAGPGGEEIYTIYFEGQTKAVTLAAPAATATNTVEGEMIAGDGPNGGLIVTVEHGGVTAVVTVDPSASAVPQTSMVVNATTTTGAAPIGATTSHHPGAGSRTVALGVSDGALFSVIVSAIGIMVGCIVAL